MKCWAGIVPVLALVPLGACHGEDDPKGEPRVRGKGEPRRILFERILISYRGNPLGIGSRRTLDEARKLAHSLIGRARAGEDFVRLRDGYSDDRLKGAEAANGPYLLLNYGIPVAPTLPHVARMERTGMGRRLGDRAFGMHAGEIALVEYDAEDYPAGYEIIHCLRRDDRTEEQVQRDLSRVRERPK